VAIDIRHDLHLSNTQVGLLGTVAVACFGLAATLAAPLSRRLGSERTIWLLLAVLTIALLVRVAGGPLVLYAGTVIACCAMAVGNVLVPPWIRGHFTAAAGVVLGGYVMVMSGSAAVASGLTVPLGEMIGLGWRGALALWAVLSAIAWACWFPYLRRPKSAAQVPTFARAMLRSPTAWHISIFFGLASFSFYALLAWLPSIFRESGYEATAAGFVLLEMSVAGSLVALFAPVAAERLRDQRVAIIVATLVTLLGLLGLLILPAAFTHVEIWVLGAGLGGTFSLSLGLLGWRTADAPDMVALSSMMNTVGYLLAALGPLAVGLGRDLTGSWTISLLFLSALCIPQVIVGNLAGRPVLVRPG
jgi:CP family cyanate transporter-like MFS transporter